MNVNSEHRHDFYAQYDKIVTDLATDVAAGTFATESIPEIVRGIKDELAHLIRMDGRPRLTFRQCKELFDRLDALEQR